MLTMIDLKITIHNYLLWHWQFIIDTYDVLAFCLDTLIRIKIMLVNE